MARKVPQAFTEMPDDHLKCRSLAHAWDPQVIFVVTYERKRAYESHLLCLRKGCGTERVDTVIESSGEIVNRRYYHPDGYLIEDVKGWGGRTTFNSNVRMELYKRLGKGAKKK